jgi:precorrin-2/cobalt-factor-2 C20-methyltransferase
LTIGTLYGLGVGPGDPDLITVKALRYLQSAAVVAYPSGRNHQPGVAQQIITPWLRPDQIQLPLMFPYVLDPVQLEAAWSAAAQQVWVYLQAGNHVAFASEGDISFYSTFTYLAQSLLQQQPHARVEAIPGICSPLAAAAVLGIPLTLQAQRLAIVPALYRVEELESILTWADVMVLMKVSSVYAQVWPILCRYGLLERSYIVERATTADQIVYADLRKYPRLTLSYFSLLICQVRPEAISGS